MAQTKNVVNPTLYGDVTIKDEITNPRFPSNQASINFETIGNAIITLNGTTAIELAAGASIDLSSVPVQLDSTATDVAGIVADFNTLLANLRTVGIIA